MRTSLDIPDPVYREIKLRAESERRTIREFILEGVAMRLQNRGVTAQRDEGTRSPVTHSKTSGSLNLGKDGAYKHIPFP